MRGEGGSVCGSSGSLSLGDTGTLTGGEASGEGASPRRQGRPGPDAGCGCLAPLIGRPSRRMAATAIGSGAPSSFMWGVGGVAATTSKRARIWSSSAATGRRGRRVEVKVHVDTVAALRQAVARAASPARTRPSSHDDGEGDPGPGPADRRRGRVEVSVPSSRMPARTPGATSQEAARTSGRSPRATISERRLPRRGVRARWRRADITWERRHGHAVDARPGACVGDRRRRRRGLAAAAREPSLAMARSTRGSRGRAERGR